MRNVKDPRIVAGGLSTSPVHHRGLSERVSDRVGGSTAHTGQHVGVGVEGDGDRCVSQKLLHELRMDVLLEEERRARVPEIVERDLG